MFQPENRSSRVSPTVPAWIAVLSVLFTGCSGRPDNSAPVKRSVAPDAKSAAAPAAELASTGYWPHWRGPNRDGVSLEADWVAKGKPEPLWSANVGLGQSSVAVAAGRLVTKGYGENTGEDEITCFDAATGRELWSISYAARIRDSGHRGGTLSTPSIDGDAVYVLDREGRLMRLGAADGAVAWSKDLAGEHGVEPPTWGFAASPFILGDDVIVNVGKTLALEKATGELRWETRDYGSGYSTPAEFDLAGRACLAVHTADGLAVIDRGNGEPVHLHPWRTSYQVNASTPVIAGSRIFISTAYQRGCAMLEFDADGMRVLWESKVMRNKMTGCVLFEDHLYGFDESMLKCIDLDGNEKWRERGLGMGTVTVAGGRLIVLGEGGELVIAGASPEGFTALTRKQVLASGVCWSTPVLAGGLIYCRNSEGELVCLDHRGDAGDA